MPSGDSPPLTADFVRGRLHPGVHPGVGGWPLEGVENCYTDALRTEPRQRGKLLFTLSPPAEDGPVRVTLEAQGSLEPDLIACARRVLGSIHHYPSRGRYFQEVSATLDLEPEVERVPALPTAMALRRVVEERFAKDRVVRVVGIEVEAVHHRSAGSSVLRELQYKVELEFLVNGYEGECFHDNTWKLFDRWPIESRGTASCKNVARRVGERAEDRSTVHFMLKERGWQAWPEPVYYCGDTRCPGSR